MKKYIIKIAFILSITAVCLQCSDDDNKTTEKSSEQTTQKKQGSEQSTAPTKQELLAKIHGTAAKYTEKIYGEGMEPVTDEINGKASFYLDKEGYLIYYFSDDHTDMWIKIKPDEVKQEDNEILVTSNTPADNIYWSWSDKEWDDSFLNHDGKLTKVKVKFNTQTHRYQINYELKDVGGTEDTGILDGKGEPVKWKESQRPADYGGGGLYGNMQARSSAVQSNILSNALSLSGVKPVHVILEPNSFIAKRVRRLFYPEGDHYVKFTSLGSDNYKVEFCDASGKVLIEEKGGTGFHGGRMPMKLYFVDVRVHYADNRFSDAGNGNNYVRVFPCDDCKSAGIPAFLLRIIDPEGMESRHAEVLNTQSKGDKCYIAVKLNLPVDFTAQITER